jgi:hypothetical protein
MAKKSKVAHGSKAAFVRANPKVAAADLVALAKKQGIKLTVGHVYNIRASDKAKKNAGSPSQSSVESSSRPSPSSAAVSSTATTELSRMDKQLRTLILRMGLYRAEQIFSELKSSAA